MPKRRHIRRTLAAIPQNLFLWLGSLLVPALSRRAELRLARLIARLKACHTVLTEHVGDPSAVPTVERGLR